MLLTGCEVLELAELRWGEFPHVGHHHLLVLVVVPLSAGWQFLPCCVGGNVSGICDGFSSHSR